MATHVSGLAHISRIAFAAAGVGFGLAGYYRADPDGIELADSISPYLRIQRKGFGGFGSAHCPLDSIEIRRAPYRNDDCGLAVPVIAFSNAAAACNNDEGLAAIDFARARFRDGKSSGTRLLKSVSDVFRVGLR